MLNRTKSFQNCKETEVPGYNDCPNLMFQANESGCSRRTVSSSQKDTYGNTKPAAVPPPPIKRAITAREALQLASKCKNKDEIMLEINTLLSKETKLSPSEFEYYKKKLLTNVGNSLDSKHTRTTMAEVLANVGEKEHIKKLITGWMISDTSISSWCPAFRKIAENAII